MNRIITTERLVIRPIEIGDCDAIGFEEVNRIICFRKRI